MNNSAPLLEVRDVAKQFGAVIALKSATLNLVRGEIHALMGANGAGKSTLVKILTGVHPADAGTVTINGATRVLSLARRSASSRHRLGLSRSRARPGSDDRPKYAISRCPPRESAELL